MEIGQRIPIFFLSSEVVFGLALLNIHLEDDLSCQAIVNHKKRTISLDIFATTTINEPWITSIIQQYRDIGN